MYIEKKKTKGGGGGPEPGWRNQQVAFIRWRCCFVCHVMGQVGTPDRHSKILLAMLRGEEGRSVCEPSCGIEIENRDGIGYISSGDCLGWRDELIGVPNVARDRWWRTERLKYGGDRDSWIKTTVIDSIVYTTFYTLLTEGIGLI